MGRAGEETTKIQREEGSILHEISGKPILVGSEGMLGQGVCGWGGLGRGTRKVGG